MELVGLAGAGKTTIFHELGKRSESILLREPPNTGIVEDRPFFIKSGLSIVPTLLRLDHDGNGRRISRREIAWMMVLNEWHRTLQQQKQKEDKVVVVDQGPIFLLAQLHVFGPESLRSRSAEKWWQKVYSYWREVIDIVVLLDAPDDCLMNRIQSRPSWHIMKGKPESEVVDFLAQYRHAYKQVLSILCDDPKGPIVIHIDTSQDGPESIVDNLLLEFGLGVKKN